MKIHYFSTSYLPSKAANAVHVMKMSAALAECGHQVTLHTRIGEGEELDFFKEFNVPSNYSICRWNYYAIPKIGSFLSGVKPLMSALFSSHCELYYGRETYTLLMAALLGLPVAIESHALPPKNSWIETFQQKIFSSRNFRGLIVISNALRDDYLARYTLPPTKVLVAPDGADSPYDSEEVPLPPAGRPFTVGYVGSLYAGRGVELLLQTAARLPWARFVFVGGTAEQIELFSGLRTSENIEFVSFVSQRELFNYYQEFDVTVAPYQAKVRVHGNCGDTSRWMSPLKIFEYFSYGKPTIASNLSVLKEVLVDGHNCILCAQDSVQEWCEAVTRLKDNESLRMQLSKNARADFLSRYTWRQRAENIITHCMQS